MEPNWKTVYIPANIYDDIAAAARAHGMSVGEVTTILLIEGSMSLAAKAEAIGAEAVAEATPEKSPDEILSEPSKLTDEIRAAAIEGEAVVEVG